MNRRVFLAGVLAACLGGSLAAPKRRVSSTMRLVPVGIDFDGRIKPIGQLHYSGIGEVTNIDFNDRRAIRQHFVGTVRQC